MIFVHISDTTSRKILGFECGTRALFDSRHGGDPLWVFVDYNNAMYRSDFQQFMINPNNYFVDRNNNLRPITP